MATSTSYFIGSSASKKVCGYSWEWGDKVITLSPRTPLTRAFDESDDPRVCLAPSVAQALNAICPSRILDSTFYVYKTTSRKLIPAESVYDYCVSGELWAKHRIRLNFCYILPSELVYDFVGNKIEPFNNLKYSITKDMKNLALARRLLKQYYKKDKP